MTSAADNPPYFDTLLSRITAGDPQTVAAFGRHVHWGYWSESTPATGTADDYGAAAERLCQKVYEPAQIRSGQKVLDVGCGFGGTIASLNERFNDLEFVGVNIDARQLARAAEQVLPASGNQIEWIAADAAKLPLADASFDVVLAVECIFHFDRQGFLSEASRVLKPGGNLTISDFVPDERTLPYLDALRFAGDEAVRWSYGQIDLSCTLSHYQAFAQEVGLTLTRESDITTETLPTYDFLRLSVESWPHPEGRELFQRATRKLEKASRKGLLGYKILRFDKPQVTA